MKISGLVFATLLCIPALMGQVPLKDSPFLRITCLKLKDGVTSSAFEKFIQDYEVKRYQAIANGGGLSRWSLDRNVLPGGAASECAYRYAYTYNGFPPETTADLLAQSLKDAGLNVTPQEYLTKRSSFARQVRSDIYRQTSGMVLVGKGQYVVHGTVKIKPEKYEEYARLLKTMWAPLSTELLNQGKIASWHTAYMLYAADRDPYNAFFSRSFPEWKGLGPDPEAGTIFQKVHPGGSGADMNRRFSEASTLHSVEVYYVLQAIESKPAIPTPPSGK